MKPCQAERLLIHVLRGDPPCEKIATFIASGHLLAGLELCNDHAVRLHTIAPTVTLKPIGDEGPN